MGHVYEEFYNTYSHENYSYILKKKFASGTTVEIEFYLGEYSMDGPLLVEVGLRSFTKRKQKNQPDFEFTVRGKDGLEPAMWATKCLLEFPDFLFTEYDYMHKDRMIYNIYWSDARRRNVYHKWLSRYGFYFDSSAGIKCLAKAYDRP